MARKRADSFKIALDTLREELRAGVHADGTRLTANDIAERLRLSQTPVREALSRLAGEGLLLDRRGQGFFVQSLVEHDLRVLLRSQLQLLLIACDEERDRLSDLDLSRLLPDAPDSSEPPNYVVASERLFRVFAAASSQPLARHLSRLHDQLAPLRALEPRVLDGLSAEFVGLAESMIRGDPCDIREALHAFFARRIAAAPTLLRRHGAGENIDSI